MPPLSLHGQLLWREFFYCAATKNPNFDRMQGNPICVQIPWDKNVEALAKWANVSELLRDREKRKIRAKKSKIRRKRSKISLFNLILVINLSLFLRQGQTGYPWIDAIMTQLREEGWIHHLARHAVACFLTRGDLWISWEEGMKVKLSQCSWPSRTTILSIYFYFETSFQDYL